MKKLILILTIIFATMIANESISQDIIILKTGDEILSKVTKVGSNEIEYKKFENLDGPIYVLEKSEIFMVKYENGAKDVFKEEAIEKEPEPQQHRRESAPVITETKAKVDNFDIVLGINLGISTMQGSSIEKVYNKGETHFRIMGGSRIKNATLLLFFEKTTATGHPLDENMNQYSNIESKLYMNIVGIQANFGKVENAFYFGPRLGSVAAKEFFNFSGETAEAEVDGTMIGAIIGLRTKKRFQVFGEINLDYFSFNTDPLDEEVLIQEEGGFIRIGINGGIRLRL